MDLEKMLDDARKEVLEIQKEYDMRISEHQAKIAHNDGIRRMLKAEEDELEKMIPKSRYEKDSEWAKALENVRVFERMLEEIGDDDGTI